MRIKQISVENFRCLQHVDIEFDEITTFIGPNGAGKSSILRALDWFFNGTKLKPLTEQDVYAGADDLRVSVQVTFDSLSESDRKELGPKYAPEDASTFTAWRIWDHGAEKMTGKALSFAPFEAIRAQQKAGEQKAAYEELRASAPELELPRWTNAPAAMAYLDSWERGHRDRLEESLVSDTNLFGFAGQGRLSNLIEYVLVTADLRASEESQDNRATVIGRILERTLDRTAANQAMQALAEEVSARHDAIHSEHIVPQLRALSGDLSRELGAFTTGRSLKLEPVPAEYKPQSVRCLIKVIDELTETDVDHQGHGFQRALLISALKLLATCSTAPEGERIICLAIEEPELFQHPTQCKAFAQALRDLTGNADLGVQVVYATHSPYFVEPRHFDQVRRVHRATRNGGGHAVVGVSHASMAKVCSALQGFLKEADVRRRLDSVCQFDLSEAVFAEAVVLVEGSDDQGVIEGTAARDKRLAISGIAVAVCGGKPSILLPHAILGALGIPCYVIFDGDSRVRLRMEKDHKSAEDIEKAENACKALNRRLLRYLGYPETDWPSNIADEKVTVFPDTLETELNDAWLEWNRKRDELICAGLGHGAKNAATYALASQHAEGPLPPSLDRLLMRIRAMTERQSLD